MIHKAVRNIYPKATTVAGDMVSDITCRDADGNSITIDQALLDTEVTRIQAEYDAQEYARNRKAEYDALNQLEMQYDDEEDGTTTWKDAIAAIKTKYPKG